MLRFFAAYAATAIVMIAIDLVWLGFIAKPLYQQGIGHLLSERPNIPVAIIFYALFALGLMIFAVAPNDSPERWGKALNQSFVVTRDFVGPFDHHAPFGKID